MTGVTVIGAGPAGSSAALSALQEGSQVTLYDKSQFPRHKVCGEFLSPEACELLDKLSVWRNCETEQPATLRRVFLSIGKRTKSWALAEPARGLSRYRMDHILLKAAVERGASFRREATVPQDFSILAGGRSSRAEPGNRLFGFKAHFSGPVNDVMSLYFFRDAYVGVNCVERGTTNVCGLAPEPLLKQCGFSIDELLRSDPALEERVAPLSRAMEWMITGPLVFGPVRSADSCYPAGDAAAFIDPFTGSGMLGAISTGILAGRAAAARELPQNYRSQCASVLKGQHRAASLLRAAINTGWAERLLPIIPGKILFHTTRPQRVQV